LNEGGKQKDGLLFIELVRGLASAAGKNSVAHQTDIIKVSVASL
jgi:hypothetical protein